jgi:hypothetical protein
MWSVSYQRRAAINSSQNFLFSYYGLLNFDRLVTDIYINLEDEGNEYLRNIPTYRNTQHHDSTYFILIIIFVGCCKFHVTNFVDLLQFLWTPWLDTCSDTDRGGAACNQICCNTFRGPFLYTSSCQCSRIIYKQHYLIFKPTLSFSQNTSLLR